MSELPKGWESAEFEKLFDFVIGGDWGKDPETFSDPDFEEAYCIRGSEIKNWTKEKGKTAAKRLIKKSSLEKRALTIGDILVEISGGGPDQPVGRTLIIDQEVLNQEPDIPKVCTNFFRLVRLSNELCKPYINLYLQQFYLSGEVVNYQGGSNNLRNLKFKEYSKISIPLPPLAEQERIVVKLDALFASLDLIKAKLDRIPELLKNFRQQVLTQAVTGKLTEEWREKAKAEGKEIGEWKQFRLGTISKLITSGSRGWAKYYAEEGAIFVRAQNINKDKLDLSDVAYVSLPSSSEGKRTLINKGDLLITITGANVTKTAIVDIAMTEAYVSQHVGLVKLTTPDTAVYIYHYLICESHGRRQLLDFAYGQGKPQLNLENLKSVQIDMPPLKEQQEIVRRVEELFAIADRVEAQYTNLKEKVDKLPQAILAKAFRGELVEQDEGDESAEVLLATLRQAQGDRQGKKGKKV